MSETLTAVPMFAAGKAVRIARVRSSRYGAFPSKRMEPGTYEVVSAGAYESRNGFRYVVKTPSGETREVSERYLVPAEGWSEWYAVRMGERAERETAKAWEMAKARGL